MKHTNSHLVNNIVELNNGKSSSNSFNGLINEHFLSENFQYYYSKSILIAKSHGLRKDEAEDVGQEGMIKLWKYRLTINEIVFNKIHLEYYFFKLVNNTTIDFIKKKNRRIALEANYYCESHFEHKEESKIKSIGNKMLIQWGHQIFGNKTRLLRVFILLLESPHLDENQYLIMLKDIKKHSFRVYKSLVFEHLRKSHYEWPQTNDI